MAAEVLKPNLLHFIIFVFNQKVGAQKPPKVIQTNP
jgi:hypothetical protein